MRRLLSLTLLVAPLSWACGDDGGNTGGGGSSSKGPATSTSAGQGGTGGATQTSSASQTVTVSSGQGGSGGDPWAGPIESLTELDLGVDDIGQNQNFPIPEFTIGLTTLSETQETGLIGITTLRPPNGGSVVLNFEIPGTDLPVFIEDFALNAGNPQSDLSQAWPVQTGMWRLRLGSDGPVSARSRVFVRRTADGVFHGGVIDFHVHIASAAGASQGYVSNVLDSMFANYYTPLVGLTRGTVQFSTLAAQYGTVNDLAEFKQMLTSEPNGSAPAIQLFVVGDFAGDVNNALGIAGGIPGSPMVHGTRRSGVGFAPTGNTNYDASVLAHEIGHLGGLFHTTEVQVSAADPLGDTPVCSNIQNPNNCPDVTNVMFPIAYGGNILSPLQARVLQGSALYRGRLTEGGPPAPPLLPAPALPGLSAVPSFVLEAHPGRPPQTELERVLSGHFCAHSGDLEAFVWDSVAGKSVVQLAQVAKDSTLTDVARSHALSILARFANPSEITPLARQLAEDPTTPRRTRVRALDALDHLDPIGLTRLAPYLVSTDPVIELTLRRLGLH